MRSPTGTVTFLFTDIEDSTRLWQTSPEVMQETLARHDAILRRDIESYGGSVFKTAGDAFYAAFPAPAHGLEAALALQKALFAEPWPEATPIRVRIAMHTGEAQLRDGEYFGPPLNLVARILTITRGGQTLLSRATADLVGDAHLDDAELESHGFFHLKGVDEPIEVLELGVPGQCAFAPPQDVDSVYRVVRLDEIWQPVRAIRHNLPAERDAFVGRIDELRVIAGRLDGGVRLLTVLGPGGTGKTRLVRRYGWSWLGEWPGGVYFCDLSEARSLEGIHFAVASVLDVPLGKGDPTVQLGHAIAGRGHCLIILDNFEQVLTHAATTLGRWLDRASDAAFVVTTRERLHLPGEHVLALEPLSLEKDAIDLFVARARAQWFDFALTETNRSTIAEVVRLLDGLPLAIELAAARVRLLSPAQLVDRLQDRFSLLAGGRGTAARQATLRAAIDWSWDLLTPWEQASLAQCSVFEGGFTLDAAEAVLNLAPWPGAPSTLDAVQALVDKSLLRTWFPAAEGRYDIIEPYFGMYVSIHEYAAEKLKAIGPEAEREAEKRHGRIFARFGTEEALKELFRHSGVKHWSTLALELDNVVAACRRAVLRSDGESAVPTYRAAWEVLELQGPFALGVVLGAEVLALDGLALSLRSAALVTRARALHYSGRTQEAVTVLEQALVVAKELRDRHQEGRVLGHLGILARACGQMDEARIRFGAALAIHQEVGDRHSEGFTLGSLAILHFEQGRTEEARTYNEAALAIHREVGDRRSEGRVLGNMGVLHLQQSRMEEARAYYEAAIEIHREVGNRRVEGFVLLGLGILHFDQGRMEEARRHFEAALAVHREVGDRPSEGIVLGNLGVLRIKQSRMDEGRAYLEAALAIHREVGARRHEGRVLGNLGDLHHEQGRIDDARPHYEAALAIARSVDDRLGEGVVLGNLGALLAGQGDLGDAREAFCEGEALLRKVGDRLELAKLLCARGLVEVNAHNLGVASSALAEAASIAVATKAGPDSELDREIVKLREALAMTKVK